MRYLACIVVFVLNSILATAQDTRGNISGTVIDSQGSVISGATIVVSNMGTGTSTRLTTNSSGYYEAPLLLPGTYTISAENTGFKRSVRSGVTLALSEQLQLNFQLELGATTDSVNISAEAPMLDTSSVSTGRAISHREVMDMPVLGNNIMMLSRMAPGVQVPGTTQFLVQGQVGGGSQYNAPGGVGGNEWSIDGASTNGTDRRVSVMPSPDTIDEFKIETSNFDASFGHSTGLSISMSSKSGSNAIHGTGTFQYFNQKWNAAPFFVKKNRAQQIAAAQADGNLALANELEDRPMLPPGQMRNYHATLSGPIYIPRVLDGRNKLFFFFGFSELKNRQSARPSELNYTVPTEAMRNGDFSELLAIDKDRYQIYDPLTTRLDPDRPGHYIRDPFVGNIIPRSRFNNPLYDFYTQRMPLPNAPASATGEPVNNYIASGMPNTVDYRSFNNRIDYQASEKHRFFVRWLKSSFLEGAQDFTYETEPGLMNWDEKRPAYTAAADWTYTLSSTTILNLTVNTNGFLLQNQRLGTRKYKPGDVGLPAYLDAKCGDGCVLPRIIWPGMPYWGSNDMIMSTPVDSGPKGRQQGLKFNTTHVRGSHSIRAGIDFRQHYRTLIQNGGFTSGTFTFSNAFVRKDDDGNAPAASIGLDWAAFILGIPSNMSIDTNDTYALFSPYYAWYGQDTWRVNRNLTITLGLRMEYERGATERYNRAISYFDPTLELPISAAAEAAYARNPIPELPASEFAVRGGTVYAGRNGAPRELWQSELMWLPRVSAAWQLGAKTVVRGGYGIYYDTLNVMNSAVDQYGFARATSTQISNNAGDTWLAGDPENGISPLIDPFPIRANGTRFDVPLQDALGAMARVGQGYTFGRYDRVHPRVQRWRIGVQRELGANLLIEASYWGQYGDRLFPSQNLRLDALPARFWNMTNSRNAPLASNLTQRVANPFHISNFESIRTSDPVLYQHMSTLGMFTSIDLPRNNLLRPFPHMNGLFDSASNIGSARTHALELNLQRRFARGFMLNASYTRMLQENRTFLDNEFETEPTTWYPSDTARPHRFTASGIYELPFGKGRAYFQTGILNHIFGGWQVAATYEFQTGPLLEWPNLFYNGDISTFEKDATSGTKTWDQWFNTSLPFERGVANQPAGFQARVFPRFFNGTRADGLNQWNANLLRRFNVTERFRLELRGDFINLQNRSQMNPPNLNPISTNPNFGRITSQTASLSRFVQVQLRLQF
jgi:Carboxypeptidase regulatory-like domain/TonB dependent receptor